MQVIPYNKDKHYDMIKEWYIQWNLPHNVLELFPETGLIVENICSISLYKTNSPVCIIENFISNKYVNDELKVKGLDLICDELENFIMSSDYKHVITYSCHPRVIERLLKKNFSISTEKFYILNRRVK